MYSNAPRTAIRFTKIKPVYAAPDFLDLQILGQQLIPWQIIRPSRPELITTFKMVRIDEFNEDDLLSIIDTALLPYVQSFIGYDVLIYKAEQITSTLSTGRYYLVVSDGVDIWYSMDIINLSCISLVDPNPVPVPNFNDNPIITDINNYMDL